MANIHVLFIQGAGTGAHQEDALLAGSLQAELGANYKVHYPLMPDEENVPYEQWTQHIEDAMKQMPKPFVLVGHSVGASVLAKYLSETKKTAAGVFLLDNPFWGGEGWLYEGYQDLEIPEAAATKFLKDTKIFLYHTRDDEVVPLSHLALYAKLFPQATVREISTGGHQLNNDMSLVAKDIKHIAPA